MKKIILINFLSLFFLNLNASDFKEEEISSPPPSPIIRGGSQSPTSMPLINGADEVTVINPNNFHRALSSRASVESEDPEVLTTYHHAMGKMWLVATGWCDLFTRLFRYSSLLSSILAESVYLTPEQSVTAKIIATFASAGVPFMQAITHYGNRVIKDQHLKVTGTSNIQSSLLTPEEHDLLKNASHSSLGKYFKGLYTAWGISPGILKFFNVIAGCTIPLLNALSLADFISNDEKTSLALWTTIITILPIFIDELIREAPLAQQRQLERLKVVIAHDNLVQQP